jgi:DnaJ-like protein
MAKETYYQILGVASTATEDTIKKAYRKLAREYHPDVNKGPDAESRFKEINQAYGTLSDSLKRADYDQTLADTGVRRAPTGAPGGRAAAAAAEAAAAGAETPFRRAMVRAALARVIVMALLAGLIGALLRVGLAYLAAEPITAAVIWVGALPGIVIGLLWGADYNFKVETFLGTDWLGRSYTFTRTILMSLGLAFYFGLAGATIDQAAPGDIPVFTAPFILLGVLAGAVIGSDGDTPEKVRSAAGRFNLLYTFLRGAEVGAVGALVGAGLGAILVQAGVSGVFGWSVFIGFALGMIGGSIKPPNLAAYASYASASIKNVLIVLMVLGALLFGMAAGAILAPNFAALLNR